MHWIKTERLKPEPNKDIFMYDTEAGFLAGYLDDHGRFICRADGFAYENVTDWAYARIERIPAQLDVVRILNDSLINKAELAARIWPKISQPSVRMHNKIMNKATGHSRQRLTENDIDLISEYLKAYFGL